MGKMKNNIDGETETDRVSDMTKATQLLSGKARNGLQNYDSLWFFSNHSEQSYSIKNNLFIVLVVVLKKKQQTNPTLVLYADFWAFSAEVVNEKS